MLIEFAFYLGILIHVILGGKLIFEAIKKDKANFLKLLRLLFNYTFLFFFCYCACMSLLIIVRVPFDSSQSIEYNRIFLNNWILKKELWIGLYGLITILLLGLSNLLFQLKIEKQNHLNPIFKITIINLFILAATLVILYFHSYETFSSDIINLNKMEHLKK